MNNDEKEHISLRFEYSHLKLDVCPSLSGVDFPQGHFVLDYINKVINYDKFNLYALITGITCIMVIQYVDILLHVKYGSYLTF